MANQVFLIAVLSAIVAVCSAESFIPRQHESERNQRQKPNVSSRPNNNNIDNYNGNSNSRTYELATHPVPVFPGFNRCDPQSALHLSAHPFDCAKFTGCLAGVLISFTCSSGSVFDDNSKSCVPKGSLYDTCSAQMSNQQTCPPGATYKKPHPQECAQFYDCDSPAHENHWEQHLRECEYPMLFNPTTTRCEHYSMVTCGIRREPFDPCEYKANGCGGHAHCVPCSVRHPSCRSKSDGMNGWEGRNGSPHYVVCASQRVVYHGMCPQEHGTQFFDHVTGTCVMMNAK